jgi:hypothetical protein
MCQEATSSQRGSHAVQATTLLVVNTMTHQQQIQAKVQQ